ncbi:hypothetical protein HDU93_005474 [Gonapodya sp. JEL0774]|nr:hypothetical protein HDU93_005474 [Gonapodya sp. JEL0774]
MTTPRAPLSLLELLPLEILHSIFRLVAPRTFYSVIPRLSRHLGAASLDAIPGCARDEIAVRLETNLESDPGQWNGPRSFIHNQFVDVVGPTGLVWVAITSSWYCTPEECEERLGSGGNHDRVCEEVVTGLVRNEDKTRHTRINQLSRGRVKIVAGTFFGEEMLPRLNELLPHIAHHARRYHIREVRIGWQEHENAFESLSQGYEMDSVTSLSTFLPAGMSAQSADDYGASAAAVHWIARLLKLFPSACKLSGAMFSPPWDSARDLVLSYVPQERRCGVKSLSIESRPTYYRQNPRYSLLLAPSVYPNLQDLGTFMVVLDAHSDGRYTFHERILTGSKLQDVIPLTQIENVTMEIIFRCTNSTAPAETGESAAVPDGSSTDFIAALTYLFPNLKSLHLRLVSTDDALRSMGFFLSSLVAWSAERRSTDLVILSYARSRYDDLGPEHPYWSSVLKGWNGIHNSRIVTGGRRMN